MNDALLSTVIDEYSTVEAFASVLALEEKALTAVEPLETLPPIVEKKTELVGKLSTLEQLRDAQLAELGYPAGWQGMELAADSDARLAAQWSLLQKAAERARRSNTLNGSLIRTRMDYNQRALEALNVAVTTERVGFYGPDGRIPVNSGL
ncbi:MAG: flagellar protein FlgN [Paraburkholderia sp.]|uniref:Flagella synthesis protein FlgN n=1 Tax=Paraburkholderia sartisoli TaxID=83784 RepID=A0A1H4G3C7_9BURK|nr:MULTISPECIES: flagellar protein FlgN [Paraburkholderia]TAL96115.1 MAG: flagellar protein FlgN [Paraburkholderia sp.]SEB04044.1 flagella synthesis protein FlgN [Paraburkholderia sartisoli]